MERYRLDVVNKTLTITAGFEAKIQDFKSAEYNLYLRLMGEIPGLTIVRNTHKSPTHYTNHQGERFNCNQFKNLTYKNMEGFIESLPDHKEYKEQFVFLRDKASNIQTNRYKVVRNWFVAQFPQFRKNPMFYLTVHPATVPAADIIQEENQAAIQKEEKQYA